MKVVNASWNIKQNQYTDKILITASHEYGSVIKF